MSITEQVLKDELKAAMKAGDTVRRSVIGLIMSVAKNRSIEKRMKLVKGGATSEAADAESALSSEELMDVIASEAKKRRESIATYEQANRLELAQAEKDELGVLIAFLPEQMSDDELRAIVAEVVSAAGAVSARDQGKIIGQVVVRTKGRADGSRVSALVREALS
ncbi:MAG: GatB/YqeY domain-containing protein [Patescibacteria group bacterium]